MRPVPVGNGTSVLSSASPPRKDELRQKTLEAARRHKASWLALGQYLHTIFNGKHYRGWGYTSFEGYCMRELHIKQNTAAKLVRSYAFMEKEEPGLREAGLAPEASPKEIPSYETVNVLRLARANKQLAEEDYLALREAALEAAKEPKELRRQIQEILSERTEGKNPLREKAERRNRMIKKLVTFLSSARREFEKEKMLPGSVLRDIEELARKLEGQVE